MTAPARVLIADDEASIRFVLREALEADGHQVHEAHSGDQARALLAEQRFDLALLDIRMPGPSGLELLGELVARGPEAPIVVILTAQQSFEHAIEAMKLGAFDFLTKPFDLAPLRATIGKALRQRDQRVELAALRRRVGDAFRTGEALVGRSRAMIETFKTIGRVAQSEASVLLRGESGTGKELAARAIHYHSRRRDGPFLAVNLAALPADLVESELFGHERGAFTGALQARSGRFRDAQGGTLLLDEIGDLPLALQAKLLRVVQDREVTPVGGQRAITVDVRIVAATHVDLERAVRDGRFREDLYFRLNVVPITMPPLRERKQDVPLLAEHFVRRFARELGVPERWPTPAALEALSAHDWPGNVRELENAIKRALVLASGEVLGPDDLRFAASLARPAQADWTVLARAELAERIRSGADAEGQPGPYWTLVARLERAVLQDALERTGGNQIRAAALLGINRNTLRKKLIELDIARAGGGPDDA